MPRITGTTACLAVVMCLLQAALVPALPKTGPSGAARDDAVSGPRPASWTDSPTKGLTIVWRTPLHGRLRRTGRRRRTRVRDRLQATAGTKGTERALCLDEKSGKVLWTREWDADYQGISYATGPRATPTVDGDRVYVVGASGTLLCLNARTGDVIWQKDYVKDYGMRDAGVGNHERADDRRQPSDRNRRRQARRQGDGVRQDDRQGNLAGAAVRFRTGLLPSR